MRYSVLLLLAVFCLPLFTGLAVSSVWDSNEAFYVETPREMVERSEWIVPYFNFKLRVNKPPLSYWLVAILYRLFGVALFWERLLMAMLGCGSIVLVYLLGRRFFDDSAALLSAGVFATTFRFLILSRRLLIDVLMLFCVLGGVWLLALWVERKQPRYLYAAAICFGLGFLAKGPVALLPMLIALLYLLLSGQRQLLPLVLRPGPWLVLAAVGLSWFVLLGFSVGWSAVSDFFLKENLGRFSHLDFGPQRGYFYYVGVFLADFLPWSFLFAGAVIGLFRSGEFRWRSPGSNEILLFWILIWILLFSLSQNKQEYYILPVYPAAALLVGQYLRRVEESRWWGLASGLLVTVAALGLGFMAQSLFDPRSILWAPVVAAMAFSISAWLGRWSAAIVSLGLFYVAAFGLYLAPLETYRPVVQLIPPLKSYLSIHPETRVGYYRFPAPSLVFYLQRPILELYDRADLLEVLRDGSVCLLMHEGDWLGVQGQIPASAAVVARRPRLATNLRTVLGAIRSSGSGTPRGWVRPILLICNEPREHGVAEGSSRNTASTSPN